MSAQEQSAQHHKSSSQFTLIEYIEFTSAKEFRKFKAMPKIDADEIAVVEWDDLCARLQAS